jgi:hypothetical protein
MRSGTGLSQEENITEHFILLVRWGTAVKVWPRIFLPYKYTTFVHKVPRLGKLLKCLFIDSSRRTRVY